MPSPVGAETPLPYRKKKRQPRDARSARAHFGELERVVYQTGQVVLLTGQETGGGIVFQVLLPRLVHFVSKTKLTQEKKNSTGSEILGEAFPICACAEYSPD